MESRRELLERLKTREDVGFPLYNLEELEKLIELGNNKDNWYCLGRKTEQEGNTIEYCIYAYSAFRNNNQPIENCTGDCEFYKKLHSKPKNL